MATRGSTGRSAGMRLVITTFRRCSITCWTSREGRRHFMLDTRKEQPCWPFCSRRDPSTIRKLSKLIWCHRRCSWSTRVIRWDQFLAKKFVGQLNEASRPSISGAFGTLESKSAARSALFATRERWLCVEILFSESLAWTGMELKWTRWVEVREVDIVNEGDFAFLENPEDYHATCFVASEPDASRALHANVLQREVPPIRLSLGQHRSLQFNRAGWIQDRKHCGSALPVSRCGGSSNFTTSK